MVGAIEDIEDRAGEAVLALDRLIGVGDGAKRDHLWNIARVAQFPLQQLGGIDFGVKLGLKIKPRRMTKIAMRRAREAIDATVLAPPIGIDRLFEADIGTIVAGDNALGRLA